MKGAFCLQFAMGAVHHSGQNPSLIYSKMVGWRAPTTALFSTGFNKIKHLVIVVQMR